MATKILKSKLQKRPATLHKQRTNLTECENLSKAQFEQPQMLPTSVPTAPFTLLKYSTPQLVEEEKPQPLRRANVSKKNVTNKLCTKQNSQSQQEKHTETFKSNVAVGYSDDRRASKEVLTTKHSIILHQHVAPQKPCNVFPVGADDTIEGLLNGFFPTRKFQLKNGAAYIQRVSAAPATRQDVLQLHDNLNDQLIKRKAKECGVCGVREALYSDCFDEILRQVTVGCAERGNLLHRFRKEFDHTRRKWNRLYDSAVGFALRKTLQKERVIAKYNEEVENLKNDVIKLAAHNSNLQHAYSKLSAEIKEKKAQGEAIHEKKVISLEAAGNALLDRIELFMLVQNSARAPQHNETDLAYATIF